MQDIIVLRHGITDWNLQKRIQGHTDIPLAAEGIAVLQQYILPTEWLDYEWLCSPLLRTRQTAETLGLKYTVEPALIEMHWGDWEGGIITELRKSVPDFSTIESKGLDMRPPQGESPRLVQQRLQQWISNYSLARAAADKQPSTIGIVTHKGVIRALLAAATDWDMLGKPPIKLDYKAGQRFAWDDQQQRWLLTEANIALHKVN